MLGSNRPHDLNAAIIFFYIRLSFFTLAGGQSRSAFAP